MKSCTNIEQSKKLAEILPLESADMYWWSSGKRYYIEAMDDGDFNEKEGDIRAWSLAALLDVIPDSIYDNTYEYSQLEFSKKSVAYHDLNDGIKIGSLKDNLVDACVETIIKLNEQKLL